MALKFAKVVLCAAALLAVFRPAALAQPLISDLKVEAISHATVAVRFQVSGIPGPTLNWIEYGPTHLLGFRTPVRQTSTSSVYRSIVIGGLKPDTSYYFRVSVASVDGAQRAIWHCLSGDGGPGFECDGSDAPPRFRTGPSPGDEPLPPILPVVSEQPFPEINGETFMVSVDDQQRCLNLQEQLNAAAAADPEKNHQVVIPAGATCYGEFVLPRKLGAGVVVIKPSTPLDRLPPSGVRIDPSFKPLMATLSPPAEWRSPGLFLRLALNTPPVASCPDPCTQGWRLVGLEITHPDHSAIAPRHARITSIAEGRSGQTLITLDRDLGLEHSQSVHVAGITGAPGLNRAWLVTPVSPSSFTIPAAPPSGASGGYVTQALSLRVESCGPGPQPVCRTAMPHGLPEHAPARIASIADGVIQTPGASWPLMSTVQVSGSPVGADGLWGAHQTPGGLRLLGDFPRGACASDCGTVTLRPSVQAFGFDHEPRLAGSRLYTVISENEVRLDDITEPTAEASDGYLAFDPNPYPRLAHFGVNSRNIVIDRCWIHGRGFPSRLHGALSFSSDDSALIDSVVSDVNSWRPISRPGGAADAGAHNFLAAASTTIGLGDVSRVAIRNNLFENCIGITIYAEQYRATGALTPSEIVISGNTFRNDDRFRAGSPDSDGRYYGLRHAIEFKRGERILIEDNVFDGNWADWTPLGPVIGLLTRGEGSSVNNRIQDVTIRGNIFRRAATGIQMLSTDDRIEQPTLVTARVAIEHNLFEDIDFYRMRSAPSGVALTNPSSNFGGQVVFATGAFEDLSITHNTALDNRGRNPAFFWYQNGRSSGVTVTDNVFTHNDDSGLGGLPRAASVSEFEARIEGPPSVGFAHVFTQTPDPDPRSKFARNLILPGVRDSSSADSYNDPSDGRNFSKAQCEAFYTGFSEIECAGSGQSGETASQRFAAAIPDRAEPRESRGRGVDLDRLKSLRKRIRDASVVIRSGVLAFEFRTDSSEPCLVDISPTPDFATFERYADSGGALRSVVLDILDLLGSGLARYYRIKCASDTRIGSIDIP